MLGLGAIRQADSLRTRRTGSMKNKRNSGTSPERKRHSVPRQRPEHSGVCSAPCSACKCKPTNELGNFGTGEQVLHAHPPTPPQARGTQNLAPGSGNARARGSVPCSASSASQRRFQTRVWQERHRHKTASHPHRNSIIRRLHRIGWSIRRIALRFMLSPTRVWEVCSGQGPPYVDSKPSRTRGRRSG